MATKSELSTIVKSVYDAFNHFEKTGIFPFENFKDKKIYLLTKNKKILYHFTEILKYLNTMGLSFISLKKDKIDYPHQEFKDVSLLFLHTEYYYLEWRIRDLGNKRYVFYENEVLNKNNITDIYSDLENTFFTQYFPDFAKDFSVSSLENFEAPWYSRIQHLNEILALQDYIYVLMDSDSINYENGNRYGKPLIEEKNGQAYIVITPSSSNSDYEYYDEYEANFSVNPVFSRMTKQEFIDLCSLLSRNSFVSYKVYLDDGIIFTDPKEVMECINYRNSVYSSLSDKDKDKINSVKLVKTSSIVKSFIKSHKILLTACAFLLIFTSIYFTARTPFTKYKNSINGYAFNYIEKYRGFSKDVVIDSSSYVLIDNKKYQPEVICKTAFSKSRIKKLRIFNSILFIEPYAFEDCKNLQTVRLNYGLREIGDYAFKNCPVTSIEIPATVYKIGDSIFSGTKLQNLTIGKTLYEQYSDKLSESIDENTIITFTDDSLAFNPLIYCQTYTNAEGKKCLGIISSPFPVFVVPEGIQVLSSYTREYEYDYPYTKSDSELWVTKHQREIYDYLGTYSNVQEIVIPDSLEEIEPCFFANSQIKEITLPDSVTTIGYDAFSNSQLTKIKLSNNITKISDSLFQNTPLSEIEFGNLITEFGYAAFAKTNIKKIVCPECLETINHYCFDNSDLEEIEFNPNLKLIGLSAFSETKVTKIEIPDSVEELSSGAFSYSNIEEVKIGKGLKTIPTDCFKFSKLKKITIPDNIETILPSAFESTPLEEVSFGNGLQDIASKAFASTQLKNVTIPGNVKKLYSYVFEKSPLESITLEEGITSFNDYVFYDTALTEIRIPRSVTYFSTYAVSGMPDIQKVYIPKEYAENKEYFNTNSKLYVIY